MVMLLIVYFYMIMKKKIIITLYIKYLIKNKKYKTLDKLLWRYSDVIPIDLFKEMLICFYFFYLGLFFKMVIIFYFF